MSPSRPLRETLIEAGAKAIAAENPGWTTAAASVDAEAALDAFLDALEARSDEWTDAAYPNSHPALHTVRSMTVRKFVAVLRKGDE